MSKPRFGEVASCVGKEAFSSPSRAHAVIARRRRNHGPPSIAYRCDHCGAWHVGTPILALSKAQKRKGAR